tara:strand:+ start:4649 stop:4921 length:273 start_codon:yes stop_codon:yes gene_type:complete
VNHQQLPFRQFLSVLWLIAVWLGAQAILNSMSGEYTQVETSPTRASGYEAQTSTTMQPLCSCGSVGQTHRATNIEQPACPESANRTCEAF